MRATIVAWNFLGTNTTTPRPTRHRDRASQAQGTHWRPHRKRLCALHAGTGNWPRRNPVEGRRVTLSGCAGTAHRVGTASPAAPRPGPAPGRGPAVVAATRPAPTALGGRVKGAARSYDRPCGALTRPPPRGPVSPAASGRPSQGLAVAASLRPDRLRPPRSSRHQAMAPA
jgi:hypothetical protein